MSEWKKSGNDKAVEEKLDSILHPSDHAKEFKITIEFGYKTSPNYEKAVDLARRNPTYAEEGEGEWIRHSATYTPEDVEDLVRKRIVDLAPGGGYVLSSSNSVAEYIPLENYHAMLQAGHKYGKYPIDT